jgi:ABC-2 type transport system ATP-binding protein
MNKISTTRQAAAGHSIPASELLRVEGLEVNYGSFRAVRNVSFSVQSGEIFGLLGPNGAGKTSTLSAIEGLLKPDKGEIRVGGFSLRSEPLQAKARIGVQLQATSFQPELQVREILRLFAGIYQVKMNSADIESVLASLGLSSASRKRYGQLSGGQQQRISLFIATIHQPDLVLLDEPTTGLDPQSRRQLWERIEGMREKGHSVLLTTHSMEEAEAVCDRVAVMDHGAIIAVGHPQALIDEYRNDPDVIRVSRRGKITLEDVFIGLTGRAIRS